MLFYDGNRGIAEDKFVQPVNKESHVFILDDVSLAFEMQQPGLKSRYVLGLPSLGFAFNLNLGVGEFGFRRIFEAKIFPIRK